MSSRLADRMNATRHGRFVGRATELALFRSALATAELPFCVLHVFGPGGVGKTTLLGEFAHLCDQAQTSAYYVDARHVDPAPECFLSALRPAMGLAPSDSPLEVLAARAGRQVVLIDTYETLAPLDGWLRESFLPQLPEDVLVVLASRHAPSPAWRADPGWQALVHVLPLRNLDPSDSRAYLTKRQVPLAQQQAVLDFTYGHPLALSLVADVFAQRPGIVFQPAAAPDVVKTLLEQLVQKVPGPAHRAALEVCALMRLTTETLLAEVLAMPDAHELFEWLRGLSFIESGPHGLLPHDLAREALAADLRWRNPDWYAELHRRARRYYAGHLQQAGGQEQQRTLFDYIFLHRDNPVVRPFFDWQESGGMLTDVARDGDGEALAAMVARHEGAESARLAAHWFARQAQGVLVLREAPAEAGWKPPGGFLAMVALHEASAEDLAADPAAAVAWRYVQHHAPLRPGEGATLFRFWMAGDTYQAVSAAQSLIFVNVVRHYLTTPGVAFTFFPCAEPDFWAPVFAYADLARLPEADFEVGGRRYGVYGHDWRAVPALTWLERLAERESGAAAPALPLQSAPLVVLSRPEFTVAVREALRDFARPEALRGNPLLRSRVVVEGTGPRAEVAARAAALQARLKDAAEALQQSPRQDKLYRALYHTYLHPAGTQERAAEVLDLPFSSFRRHLKTGVEQVAEALWRQEIGGL